MSLEKDATTRSPPIEKEERENVEKWCLENFAKTKETKRHALK
jgi:hypothetical protein